jgi:hypothetical protein
MIMKNPEVCELVFRKNRFAGLTTRSFIARVCVNISLIEAQSVRTASLRKALGIQSDHRRGEIPDSSFTACDERLQIPDGYPKAGWEYSTQRGGHASGQSTP